MEKRCRRGTEEEQARRELIRDFISAAIFRAWMISRIFSRRQQPNVIKLRIKKEGNRENVYGNKTYSCSSISIKWQEENQTRDMPEKILTYQ